MSQSFAEALSWVPVSATFSATLGRAHEYAVAQAHRSVTLEHLLLALAEDPDANVVLQASNIDIGRLMHDASAHLGHNDDRIPPGHPVDPGADEALIRILDYAAAAARQSRRREINGAIVLAAIVGEAHSVAASMLQAQGLTFEGAIKALQRAPAAQAQRPQGHALPAPTPAPSQPYPVSAVPPQADVAGINGTATQTNEQILANVRRRIDANRTAPRPVAVKPVREPYPPPPEKPAPTPKRDEVARPAAVAAAPPVSAAPAVPPVSVVPAAPPVSAAPAAPPVAVVPAPPTAAINPTGAPIQLPGDAAAPAPSRPAAATAPEDPYTGLYPELPQVLASPSMPAAPARPADGAPTNDARYAEPFRPGPAAGEGGLSSRLPPPLPPPMVARPAPAIAEAPPSPLRPRQHGAPVAPPSSVPWPAPVQPQPSALSPTGAPPPSPQMPPEMNPLDGGIAGAPYPEPDSVPPRSVENVPVPVRRPKTPKVQGRPSAAIQAGQLVENIPRAMRVGKMEVVEVRISRASVKSITDGMQGAGPSYLHELIVTKAMSVRLRSLDRGFAIEPGSPETQWIDNSPAQLGDEFASWRWNITPLRRGRGQLQLIVSARTIASDGLSADTALPDQVFDIVVATDYLRLMRRVAGWIGLMFVGGMLSKFGQNSLDTATAIWRGFQ